MSLVQAKCTNCGANLEVDNSKDAAICSYCGTPFIVEKAINNYNVTNNFHAGVINVFGGNSADFVITAGTLLKYNGVSTDVVIPDTVIEIGSAGGDGHVNQTRAFRYYRNLTSVSIPESVKRINVEAFCECEGLTNINLPNSLTSIGEHAFWGCSGLTSITIPNSVTKIGNHAFSYCTALTSVTIPDSVTELDGVFSDCTALTSVTIPNSITKLDGVFSDCTALTSVTIPDSVTSIGCAFNGCKRLNDVTISPDLLDKYADARYGGAFEGTPFQDTLEMRKSKHLCLYCGGKLNLFTQKCTSCGRKKSYDTKR